MPANAGRTKDAISKVLPSLITCFRSEMQHITVMYAINDASIATAVACYWLLAAVSRAGAACHAVLPLDLYAVVNQMLEMFCLNSYAYCSTGTTSATYQWPVTSMIGCSDGHCMTQV
jgi:hypothetical protein